MNVYIDIETLPAIDWPQSQIEQHIRQSVPKTYKKPESVNKWVEAQLAAQENAHTKTALHPLHARLYVVGVAIGDAEPIAFTSPYYQISDPEFVDWSECQLLIDVARHIHAARSRDVTRLVAWNGAGFDFPRLYVRCLRYLARIDEYLRIGAVTGDDAPTLLAWLAQMTKPAPAWKSPNIDPYHELTGGSREKGYRLGDVAEYFGVDGKSGDGSSVFGLWQENDHDAVAEYCKQDVRTLRAVHRVIDHE